MAHLDKQTYIDQLGIEGRALLATLDRGPEVMVPTCPGWTVGDLVVHTARVWAWIDSLIANPSVDPPSGGRPEAPADGDDVVAWASDHLDTVLADVAGLDTGQEMWTFGADSTAAFYPRRLAHETAVHRWDAENALGSADPIDASLATDGVDEFFEFALARRVDAEGTDALPDGSLHLHRTDGEGEWMVQVADGGLQITQEHGKGDCAVRGSASDLLIYVWSRGQGDSIEVFGDQELADAWGSLAP